MNVNVLAKCKLILGCYSYWLLDLHYDGYRKTTVFVYAIHLYRQDNVPSLNLRQKDEKVTRHIAMSLNKR